MTAPGVDVVTFGETMIVFNPETQGPFRHAHRFGRSIGGAESNVAIGLTRLGRSAAWVSKVSADAMGEYVLSVIRGEGVDVSHVMRDPAGFTGLIVKERPGLGDPSVFFYRKGAAASTLSPTEFPYQAMQGARFLHATGIFPALSPQTLDTARHVFREARAANLRISFDPNMRRKLWSPEQAAPVMRELAAQAEILLPGLDEAELLVGPGSPEEQAAKLLQLGPALVVIKLGPEGALVAETGARPVHVAGKALPPKDTVGAGDAFAAAFLTGLLEGVTPETAAAWGCAGGALATQVVGDYEGLPTRAQLERYLQNRSEVTR